MQHSQYGECELILKHFNGRVGRFLDVGAYDGWLFSNTRCLMERGWSGICVEPNPMVFPYLCSKTQDFPLVQRMQTAIIPDTYHSNPRMWVHQDALSTMVPEQVEMIQRQSPKVTFKETRVPVMKWHQFLAVNPEPYDFINIDVEGWNWEILRDGPLAEMVCVEMDKPHIDRMKDHFTIFGMPNQKEIGANLLAWR